MTMTSTDQGHLLPQPFRACVVAGMVLLRSLYLGVVRRTTQERDGMAWHGTRHEEWSGFWADALHVGRLCYAFSTLIASVATVVALYVLLTVLEVWTNVQSRSCTSLPMLHPCS